jgi:competence protein ComEA
MTISFHRLVREYPYESILVGISLLVTGIYLIAGILTAHASENKKQAPITFHTPPTIERKNITVDVSGSVVHPDIYSFDTAPRIKDVIERAGGFTNTADTEYVARNFNMARFVSDQEKIYIPSQAEIYNGIFTEQPRTLEYLAPVTTTTGVSSSGNSTVSSVEKIHINSATTNELDSLPGIGTTLSKAIIDHRPYANVNELLSKKVLKQAQFTKIKDKIAL